MVGAARRPASRRSACGGRPAAALSARAPQVSAVPVTITSVNTQPSEEDRKLLNLVQKEVELTAEPFKPIAVELGTTEEDVLARLRRLRDDLGVIRQISAIFDTRKLGYTS